MVGSVLMAGVMIGIGPRKSSHAAVAIRAGEEPLGELPVRAGLSQAEQLLAWAAGWPERAWAVEGAAGLGHLLAQQLVAAGEQVLDVPPRLGARARLLASRNTSKNDPGDACPVAVAALRDASKKLAAAVRASGTSLTGLFGVGPVIAGTVIGDVRQVFRFPGRNHFAARNGTAPVEASPGDRKRACRLSLRGNRRLNHAIHMAAISQIRHQHSDGRACYDKKAAEGKTHKEALRALNRRTSDAIYAAPAAGARRAAARRPQVPGGQPGNRPVSRAAGSHPARRLFGQATAGPATTTRPGATAGPAPIQPNRAHQRRARHSPAASKKPRTTT
jgi:transposase